MHPYTYLLSLNIKAVTNVQKEGISVAIVAPKLSHILFPLKGNEQLFCSHYVPINMLFYIHMYIYSSHALESLVLICNSKKPKLQERLSNFPSAMKPANAGSELHPSSIRLHLPYPACCYKALVGTEKHLAAKNATSPVRSNSLHMPVSLVGLFVPFLRAMSLFSSLILEPSLA